MNRADLGLLAAILLCGCGDRPDDGNATADTSTASTGADTSGASASMSSTTNDVSTTTSVGTDATTSTSGVESSSEGTSTAVDESTSTGAPETCAGTFPAAWPDGTDCGSEAAIFVHRYDDDTWILRQSLCTSFEGPFMYLMFGDGRVLLEDTGDGGIPIAEVVYGIIDDWLAEQGRASIELVVVNSHAHGDHVAGNPQFEGQPNTVVVTPSVAGVSDYFGIDDWPTQSVPFDLGGRVVDVIPIPGHQQSHIALFDHGTGMLLTGDTLYPGRLYIDDFDAYVASVGRLVDTVAEADVCHVMGTHVEMTDMPGVDFDFGADQHPGEHVLELQWSHLVELRDAVEAMQFPQIEIHDDFIVYPL
ncbi:MAG TPA: MBL fold metallo-hydrolase [Nannocystaceae bacterium]|nr:MBL fold metallo-hydrolase [Nannocystaceae bacterium]